MKQAKAVEGQKAMQRISLGELEGMANKGSGEGNWKTENYREIKKDGGQQKLRPYNREGRHAEN